MFATAVPGLAPLVSRELAELPGITVTGTGFDGRSDVVLFEAEPGDREAVSSLRTAEDVFVEVGRTLRAEGDDPRWIARRIWRPRPVQRALSVWAEQVRPLSASMTFRVITRVLQERAFRRTELRRHLTRVVGDDKPRWKQADPAQVEIWASEYQRGKLVAGLRLSGAGMRQHGGRAAERPAALRPTVAASMVRLAGKPSGVLLDPACGSGTILAEAAALGWQTRGVDIDADAVLLARRNASAAEVHIGDARRLDLPDGCVRACVSNLPFGRQYDLAGGEHDWLGAVFAELFRVTVPGGRIVLLRPRIPRTTVPDGLRLAERFRVRLLGTATTIWAYDRT